MQHKSLNNVAMESKAYNLVKQIKETGLVFSPDHIYCNPVENENNSKKDTVNNLKSLLLSHLELVKEQADQIVSKDKLIAKLKHENDELKARLEKYEQKKNNINNKHQQHTQQQQQQHHQIHSIQQQQKINNNKRMSDTGLDIIHTMPPSSTINNNINNSTNKKTKGRIITINNTNVNGLPPLAEVPVVVEKPAIKRRKVDKSAQKTPNGQQQSPDPYEFKIESNEEQPKQEQQQQGIRQETFNTEIDTEIKKDNKIPRNAFITTENEYILCNWKKSVAEIEAEEEPVIRATLEIPSWSIIETRHQCTPYSIDGTENMTDDNFMKRHTKYETDERRRKKWDVQRLREQKQVERLKKRYAKTDHFYDHHDDIMDKEELLEQKGITSFYPSPENIKFIQIVDELPVLAFGEPIPQIREEIQFILPWMMTNKNQNEMSPTTSFTKTRFFSKKK